MPMQCVNRALVNCLMADLAILACELCFAANLANKGQNTVPSLSLNRQFRTLCIPYAVSYRTFLKKEKKKKKHP